VVIQTLKLKLVSDANSNSGFKHEIASVVAELDTALLYGLHTDTRGLLYKLTSAPSKDIPRGLEQAVLVYHNLLTDVFNRRSQIATDLP
jgi:hypothetical protein